MTGIDDLYAQVPETAGTGTTSCGVTGAWAIPGVFSRLGAPRCPGCCEAVGLPRGTGSPLNDETCRPLVKARVAAIRGEGGPQGCRFPGQEGAVERRTPLPGTPLTPHPDTASQNPAPDS